MKYSAALHVFGRTTWSLIPIPFKFNPSTEVDAVKQEGSNSGADVSFAATWAANQGREGYLAVEEEHMRAERRWHRRRMPGNVVRQDFLLEGWHLLATTGGVDMRRLVVEAEHGHGTSMISVAMADGHGITIHKWCIMYHGGRAWASVALSPKHKDWFLFRCHLTPSRVWIWYYSR